MRVIDRLKAWYHRNIVADYETSRRLDALDQELDRAEMERRIDQHLRGKDRATEYLEQAAECKGE